MSKISDLNDFFQNTVSSIKLKDAKRCGKIAFANRDVSCQLEYFDTGSGIGYCDYDLVCNDKLRYFSQQNA